MAAISYPIAVHLEARRCLVVGSGDEAARRAASLGQAGAHVIVVAAAPCDELVRLAQAGGAELVRRPFADSDLDDAWLVVQTDREPALAERVGNACAERRIFFCATDYPAHNGFSHMAIARAGLVKIAISTDGRAPALGRRLREELQRLLDRSGLADFAERLAALRERTPSAERAAVLGAAVQAVRLTGELELTED
jgi:siroheme synthase-like protein